MADEWGEFLGTGAKKKSPQGDEWESFFGGGNKKRKNVAGGDEWETFLAGGPGEKVEKDDGKGILASLLTNAPVRGALTALDMPGRVIRASIHEASDAIGSGDASMEDFAGYLKNGIGTGDFVDTGNKWADRGLGLAGDILTDPFSYLSFGASGAAMAGVKGGARAMSKKAVANALAKEGLTDVADDVMRKGIHAADKDVLEKIGIQKGARFRAKIPGTDIGFSKHVGGEGLYDFVGKHVGENLGKVGGAIGSKLPDQLRTLPITNPAVRGGIEEMRFREHKQMGESLAKGIENAGLKNLDALNKQAKEVGLTGERVNEIMQGAKARNATEAVLARRMQTILRDVLFEGEAVPNGVDAAGNTLFKKAEDLTGRSRSLLEDYAPWQHSVEARKLVAEAGKRTGKQFGSLQQRGLKDADTFMGEAVDTTNNATRQASMNRIYRDKVRKETGADVDVDLFETDAFKLANSYIRGMSRSIAQDTWLNRIKSDPLLAARPDPFDLSPSAESVAAADEIAKIDDHIKTIARGRPEPLPGSRKAKKIAPLLERQGELKGTLEEQRTMVKSIAQEKHQAQIAKFVADGLEEIAADTYAEPWVKATMEKVAKATEPKELNKFIETFDWVTNRWKAYALLSPGYHFRNLLGGMFNNSFEGVDRATYGPMMRNLRQYQKGGINNVNPELRPYFKEMEKFGVLHGGNIRDISDIPTNGIRRKDGVMGEGMEFMDPTSLNNPVLAFNAKQAQKVEDFLRGSLFVHMRKKGSSVEEALEGINNYHFDYSELSPLETDVARRAIPFFTWTRKNFPLQVEQMWRNPGKYTMYTHIKNNLELGTEEEETVPEYYEDQLAIRSPFKTNDDERIYFMPDLPFRDLSENLNPEKGWLGSMNPIIKAPAENIAGKKFQTGVPMKDDWVPAPTNPAWDGILAALEPFGGKFGLPDVKRADDGTLMTTEREMYKIEQAMPVLGRFRRLYPSEKKYQDRAMTSWISFLAGLSSQTNTASAQQGEKYRVMIEEEERKKIDEALAKGSKQG